MLPKSAKITIFGKPRGKPRARYDSIHHHTYRKPEDVAYETDVIQAWMEAGSPSFGSSALEVTVIASDELPKSRPKRVASERFTTKPDVDNLAKAITDPLNGRAWDDDAHIVRLTVIKRDRRRDEVPRVEVTIEEIGEDTLC